ncbi:MAG: cell envelope integrity protein TolA [Lachnospiraceae bacterium]|nr:cell envelope integrity protein TolA [Lachnospiraceae bacterium]
MKLLNLHKAFKTNRNYKDSVFRMLFGSDQKALLSLYNAVNGTSYNDPSQLEINTLEDAICAGMHNDVSFVFHDVVNLYEHQSTLNPNMPLRDLFYVSDLLKIMIHNAGEEKIYGKTGITIPTPRFVIFYNGTEHHGDLTEIRLSDLFGNKEEHPQLELTVHLININEGEENQVLKNCRLMREYSVFVGTVRRYMQLYHDRDQAIGAAIDECINNGILERFLKKERAKVVSVLYDYDEKKVREWQMKELEEEKKVLKAEIDSARAERDRALAEKDSALAEKDSALAEKDSALAEKDSALAEKDALIHSLQEKLKAAGLSS